MCPNPGAHKLVFISSPGLMTPGCITAALAASSPVGVCAPAAPGSPNPGVTQPMTCKTLGVLESWAAEGEKGKEMRLFCSFLAINM